MKNDHEAEVWFLKDQVKTSHLCLQLSVTEHTDCVKGPSCFPYKNFLSSTFALQIWQESDLWSKEGLKAQVDQPSGVA